MASNTETGVLRKIFIVFRAYSWPASLVPVVIGTVAAARDAAISWPAFWLTFAAALLTHSAANLANTYFDWRNGVDRAETADDRGILDGLIGGRAAPYAAVSMFAAAGLIGLWLAWSRSVPELVALGAAGFALAWFYTADGSAYKYRALGEIGIFLAFGPLITGGTALIQSGRLDAWPFLLSVPVGLLIVAILHANNMRDAAGDRAAGISTLAMKAGPAAALAVYRALVLAPFLVAALYGLKWAFLAPLLSLPLALRLIALARGGRFTELVPATAGLVTAFGLLFATGLHLSI
ncbi:MAG: 1 4-dihydroxy-2-naphthoate octaprenyltransferase [Elusimicrobia bacterium]|nr:MAG: 1 4-dihydroxy-2-naphthoate octaprenyltransferase [Elusimicrobiota bacterium]